ncbi:MAG: hypothetical protein R3Y40_02885 [Eubacteriales bacterium]
MKEKLKNWGSKITKKQKITSVVVAVVLIICIVGGTFIYQMINKGEAVATLDMASLYQDEIVTVGDIVVGVSESGTASLVYEEIELAAEYEVTETIAEVGVYVEEGDILATIDLENSDLDDTSEAEALEEAEETLTQKTIEIEAQMLQAESTYNAAVAAGESAYTIYELELQEIEDGKTDLEDDIDELETNIADYEDQLANGLDSDYGVADAETALTSAEADLVTAETDLATAEAAAASAQGEAALETEATVASTVEAAVTEAEKAVETAEDNVEKAEDDYDSAYELMEEQLEMSENELSSKETEYTRYLANMDGLEVSAKSSYDSTVNTYSNAYESYTLTVNSLNDELEAAEEAVTEAEAALEDDEDDESIVIDEDGNLLAPCTGYITTVVEPTSVTIEGNTMESGLSITISDERYAEVAVSVSQDDIADVSVGMQAYIVFDAYEEITIVAEVTSMSLTPSSEISTSVNYDVSIVCDIPEEEDMTIFSSMTATVTFVEYECTDVLVLSSNYIVYEDAQQYVYLESADGSVELVEIETGFSDGFDVEIISGLEAGDIIINESAVTDIEN